MCVEPDLDPVVQQCKQRSQREGGHKHSDKPILDHCIYIYMSGIRRKRQRKPIVNRHLNHHLYCNVPHTAPTHPRHFEIQHRQQYVLVIVWLQIYICSLPSYIFTTVISYCVVPTKLKVFVEESMNAVWHEIKVFPHLV